MEAWSRSPPASALASPARSHGASSRRRGRPRGRARSASSCRSPHARGGCSMTDSAFPDPEELARELRAAPPIEQRLPAEVGFYILAYLQLAFRHPGTLDTHSGRVVRLAARELEQAIAARVPSARALLAAGWDSAHDRGL